MAKRMKARLRWHPKWEGGIKGWAINFIRKNKWRCDGIHGSDDLLQDAYLTFMKISDAYPRVIEDKHFMSLFKTALYNQTCDKSRYLQRKALVVGDVNIETCEFGDSLRDLSNNGLLVSSLNGASADLKLALQLVSDKSSAVWLRSKGKLRENLNMRVGRVLGKKEFNFTSSIREMLT